MKVFRDPVHNIVYFDKDRDELLLALIDTEEFQRLRHINQLGVSSFTYPGASHSRFAHSIGVTHLMKRFIDKILHLKDPSISKYQEEIEKHRLLALAAALLHDIGHGPFSHAVEKLTGIDHENISIAIINGNTKVNELLEGVSSGFAKEVSDVIRRTHPSQVTVKLLSSQLDVDRIDYLLRDSVMTGAKYGEFDLEWLINVLRIGKRWGEVEVGLDLNKGLSVAEDFIMARYYMHKHVYFHKATRSVEIMIRKILKRAKVLHDKGKLQLSDSLNYILSMSSKSPVNNSVLHYFLQLTDHTIWHYIFEWKDSEDNYLSNLCKNILRRRLFKSIPTPDPDRQMKIIQKVTRAAQDNDVSFDDIYYLDMPETFYYKDEMINGSLDDKEASEQIILFDEEGNSFELSGKSSIIVHTRNKLLKMSRVYFPQEYIDIFR